MFMTSTEAWVGGALRRVKNAVTIVELHGERSTDLEVATRTHLEESIRQALRFGFSVEAVAAAASMTRDEVTAVADGSAAA